MKSEFYIANKKDVDFNIINVPKRYEVDFEKVDSIYMLGILIEVLFKELNVSIQENSKSYELLKDVLKEIK